VIIKLFEFTVIMTYLIDFNCVPFVDVFYFLYHADVKCINNSMFRLFCVNDK